MGIIARNPCQFVELPRVEETEQEIYSESETNFILELLHKQKQEKHFDFVLYFTLAIFTGFSRQELLGLEYKDFDFERSIVTLKRGSKYNKDKGVYTGALKTKHRYRTMRLPTELIEFVLAYQAHQAEYIESIGDKWVDKIKGLNDKMVENDRLFTQQFGEPMHPNAPALFFGRFCGEYGFKYINPHGIRHTKASISIWSGADVKTLQGILGHLNHTKKQQFKNLLKSRKYGDFLANIKCVRLFRLNAFLMFLQIKFVDIIQISKIIPSFLSSTLSEYSKKAFGNMV